jgi:glycosyltransferase involved in cell wall biosynthesis
VDLAGFSLRPHSKALAARVWRNSRRMVRGRPPLLDRYSGYEGQLAKTVEGRTYDLGVVEHFWCAPYADLLRPHCRRLVLDLHNIESQLARTHAGSVRWPTSWASARFADGYQRLEREWIPKFDTILVVSESDRGRIPPHPDVRVYPNALPEIDQPYVPEADAIVFSGNLEYHPNVEAVRWFRTCVWPLIRERCPEIEWRLVGRNQHAIARWTGGDSRIRVVGPVEDAVSALAEVKVCIVPLLSGSGTRFKILEAWAAGRAVVSTTIGAEGLNARPGQHLLLADDAGEFAGAVEQLLKSPDLRKRLGEAGRAVYRERFTWPVAWRLLEEAGL